MSELIERKPWPVVFMQFANILAERSTCLKYKTAAIVVSGTQVISLGYNGTFDKSAECCDYWFNYWFKHVSHKDNVATTVDDTDDITEHDPELGHASALMASNILKYQKWLKTLEFRLLHREWAEKNEVHAEINALNWISKRDVNENYCLYTMLSPCDNCAKTIISYGIKTVYYQTIYPNGLHAINLLKSVGVNCIHIN